MHLCFPYFQFLGRQQNHFHYRHNFFINCNLQQWRPPSTQLLFEPTSRQKIELGNITWSSWTGSHTQLFSFGDNCYKQINRVAMGSKMGPSYANLFVGYIEIDFSLATTDQNLIFTNVTSMTASALLHPAEKSSTNLLPQSGFSPDSKIHLGNFRNFISFPRH